MRKNCPVKRTMIGGQALMEGLMMRGPEGYAITVRKSDGTYAQKDVAYAGLKSKSKFWGIPVIRGAVGLFESMRIGISALNFSAEIFAQEELADPEAAPDEKEQEKQSKMMSIATGIATVIGVILPIVLFFFLPTLIAGLYKSYDIHPILRNLMEGGIRIVLFTLFLLSVSQMKDIKRTFAFHGAEHKAIHCYEADLPLTVENIKQFPKAHPRCGTSFLFVVMIVSILVFSLVNWSSNTFIRFGIRIAFLPLVIGLSYEMNRFAGRYDNFFTRFLRAPGMLFQAFTTNEPDADMIEVAIDALTRVIPQDKEADKW